VNMVMNVRFEIKGGTFLTSWGIFLFTTASRTALGSTRPPIQWVPGALSLGIKRPRSEADHSAPSSAEVEEREELYLHSPYTPSWRGAQLNHRDNCTVLSYYYQLFRKECALWNQLLSRQKENKPHHDEVYPGT
jgi:hypothetical protein